MSGTNRADAARGATRDSGRTHEIEAGGRLALRERWVGAAEAALDLRTARHFMEWLHKFVQPVLQFQMVACGTGLFAPRTVQMDRLLVRGFPRQTIEAWRNPHGVIVLPRAVRRRDGLVYPVEFRVPRQGSARGGPPGPEGAAGPTGRLAALDRVEIGCGIGSYFLFGSFGQAPGPEQHYLAAILAPILHAVLTQTLNADVRLRPPAPLGVHLTRRELELLHELVAGHTSQQIAAASQRSRHTVKNQIRAILIKLEARNRPEAIATALGLGLIRLQRRPAPTHIVAAQPRARYIVSGSATRMTKADGSMVVDHSDRLQVGIDNRRADETKAGSLQILRDPVGQRGRGRSARRGGPVPENRLVGHVGPEEAVKTTDRLAQDEIGAGIGDGCGDLQAVADDPGIGKQACDLALVVACNPLGVPVVEHLAVVGTLVQYRLPAQSRLGTLEVQHFEELPFLMARLAPFAVVVGHIEGIGKVDPPAAPDPGGDGPSALPACQHA
jgi:DNA-binding CsgD family transcriptional regulator